MHREIALFHYGGRPDEVQQIIFANHSPGVFDKDREDLQCLG